MKLQHLAPLLACVLLLLPSFARAEDGYVVGGTCSTVGMTHTNAQQTAILACLYNADGILIWKSMTASGAAWTEVYDSGWFPAQSNGTVYTTGSELPTYNLSRKADFIKLFYATDSEGSNQREVPAYQITNAEMTFHSAYGNIYGPQSVIMNATSISVTYGTNGGGACWKFGPGLSANCAGRADGSEIFTGNYYSDSGYLRLMAFVINTAP